MTLTPVTQTPAVPVLLLILDGWGLRDQVANNAIALAKPAFYQHLLQTYPWIPIEASGEAVGLPDGQMGNSEVGHLNLGAGRVVYQELTRINKDIRDSHFFSNPVLLQAMQHAKTHNSTLHLMGLCSDGGVHSSMEHIVALLEMAKDEGVEHVRVHAFLDGRDVAPRSAEGFLRSLEENLLEMGYPQIATITGRYYAMDRDNRWERVQPAYDNLTLGSGSRHMLSIDALLWSYRQDESDEFVKPMVTDLTYEGMQDNDAVIFFNFRPDRARELTQAFVDPCFKVFDRQKTLKNLCFVTMTPYDPTLNLPVAYPKIHLDQLLGEVVSQAGLTQFRTAETEKYAHVTYFFNGGREVPFDGEDRKLIPSPQVATYDMQPEMSLPLLADTLTEAIESGQYPFIVSNFANPDMVGHTGKLDAAIAAVKAVDKAVEQVITAVLAHNGVALIVADHGNIETMVDDATGGEHTAHTTNPVPLVLVSQNARLHLRPVTDGALANVAPTLLDLLGLPIPPDMTSASLLLQSVSVPVA
jgi:2,3-bisphosphoglycerate-independent phosphoglycerate mutase